jgi:streptomycin 6-kinase
MLEQLNRYLQMWNLSDPQLLAETVTSRVYTVTTGEERVILKLLTPLGVQDERNGAVALRCFAGQGAVRLLREDEQAHLLEYAEGEDLTTLVKRGEDDRATAIIADVLNRLHAACKESLPEGLTPLRTWFRSLFRRAEGDRRDGLDSIYRRAASIAENLLADPYEVRVLHGDIHHENIRHHAQRGWLAFDPKGLVGERTFDAANTLCNPVHMPELVENEDRLLRNAEILAQALGIDLSRILAFVFAYVCLSASWLLEDGQYPRHELRIAEIAEPHVHS